ncbi:hypothetical protein D210916BOD24_09810 [Alteromonas sp. D210916BOD_24]|uniref:hypothetical protein n=1 Tax=Alteromonas sp. D210916BOD_24 TaxID=3157618 RepID=UPI00399D4DB2
METLIRQNKESFFTLFQSVNHHQINLGSLNTWWDKVVLIGKINSLNVPQSLLINMLETKTEFAELQATLIDNLLSEQLQQRHRRNSAVAQVLVDIPNRNLFERTADVGFLATDADLIAFLTATSQTEQERDTIHQRLKAYAAKYTVYDDILLIDTQGDVKAQLDINNPVVDTNDPIITEVLTGSEAYYEICRYSCLRPNQALSSLFLAPIRASSRNDSPIIGILCLSFKLEDEMHSLFEDLSHDKNTLLTLLDTNGNVLVSNRPRVLPQGTALPVNGEYEMVTLDTHRYLITRAKTRGYQGYMGLGWQGCVLLPLIANDEAPAPLEEYEDNMHWQGFSPSLKGIQRRAKIVTDDLDLVVLNGRIAAARSDADEFIPILEEIRNIGRQMQSIFSESVNQLMTTAQGTHFNDLKFDAALAIDIMDRNLYERANDCRWWALTTKFIQVLGNKTSADCQQSLSEVLRYINDLYTVYTCIYLYDESGTLVAASTPTFDSNLGSPVNTHTRWQGIKLISSPQQYCVSDFVPSPYYDNKHTYIYNAAIHHNGVLVGGIGLVFDSAPQFQEMLEDIVGGTQRDRIAVYIQRNGMIIGASKNAPWQVGDTLNLPASITEQPLGHQSAGIFSINDVEYTVGYAVSKGYREYKVNDDYQNDVIALVAETNVGKQ